MIQKYNNFTWWLNLTQSSQIADSDFVTLKNMFYNSANQVQSRKWYIKFGDSVWSTPFSSYFFHKRDDTWAIICLWVAGSVMYKFNGSTWSSIKTDLTAVDGDWNPTRWDFAVYKNIVYMCDGYNNYASRDGTTYTEYAAQPKCKYISYMLDAIYASWEIANPITVYHTAVQPTNANTINTNVVVIGWDEQGKINGMHEYGQTVLIFKDNKIFSYIPWESAQPIDTQSGGYSDRSISIVWNSLVHLTERWIDTLQFRNGVTGASWLEGKPLWEKVRPLTNLIQPIYYNSNVWYYNKALNNYYFSFDSNGDDRPDKTLVFSSSIWSRSQYTLPPMYDMWIYIDSDWVEKHIFSSALGGQMYEMEVWYDDDGSAINTELQTKPFDFGDPAQTYSIDFIDIIWYKQEWWEIDIEILWDDEVIQSAMVTDDNIEITSNWIEPLGVSTLWTATLWWSDLQQWLALYPFVVRLQSYNYLSTISLNMSASWVQRIFEKIRISINGQPIELFSYNNIL